MPRRLTIISAFSPTGRGPAVGNNGVQREQHKVHDRQTDCQVASTSPATPLLPWPATGYPSGRNGRQLIQTESGRLTWLWPQRQKDSRFYLHPRTFTSGMENLNPQNQSGTYMHQEGQKETVVKAGAASAQCQPSTEKWEGGH